MTQRLNLHDTLKRQRFDNAVICTFTFEPQFFEGYCLDRFKSLAENNNITVIVDHRVYDSLLDVPASEWPRQANVRYLLHPVRVPGVFHPKVMLFASAKTGLLIIGSANFTRAGLTSNAELVGVYEFELHKREAHLPLFHQAVSFLLEVHDQWPSQDLRSNLDAMFRDASWLVGEPPDEASPIRLVHNLQRSIFEQIAEGINAPVDELHVLSRYFERSPDLLDIVAKRLRPRKGTIWTQSGVTTMTPAWFEEPSIRSKRVAVKDVSVLDDGRLQQLHAKAVAILHDGSARLAFGSANFSDNALISTATDGNVEAMLLLDSASVTSSTLRKLFDPSGNARVITNVNALSPGQQEDIPPHKHTPIALASASLSEETLRCDCASNTGESLPDRMNGVVNFGDGGEERIPLAREGSLYVGRLNADRARRCGEGVTVVFVESINSSGGAKTSNSVFLLNLKDIETGGSQRRERRVREATQSAEQFAAVLRELLESDDAEQLQNFLTYCDIPVIDMARPPWLRGGRPPMQDFDAMRALGQRNLRAFATLHEAAVGFCERHLRRMQRHCERASVEGIPNFMHIALSVGNVLNAQVERLLIGLEMATVPLTIDEWYEHRQRLNRYLRLFSDVMQLLGDDYLPKLLARYKGSAVRDALQPDLKPLSHLCEMLLRTKARIEACRAGNLRILVPNGQVQPPQFFEGDLVHQARWSTWDGTVREAVGRAAHAGAA